jgi:hypothetical protein
MAKLDIPPDEAIEASYVLIHVELPTVENLELDQVLVNRMSITGGRPRATFGVVSAEFLASRTGLQAWLFPSRGNTIQICKRYRGTISFVMRKLTMSLRSYTSIGNLWQNISVGAYTSDSQYVSLSLPPQYTGR